MSYARRIAAAVLCACFLLRLTSYAVSRDGLYFVAVENMVAPLTEETMPFWHDGYLYISSDVFTGAARDALGISRAKIGDGVLLYRGEQSLLFRNNYPYAQDSQEETYAPGMVWHEGSAYVPASVVARAFNLAYSTVSVKYGKLVWLRSDSFKMQDAAFAKAAEFQLNRAYQEYLQSLEPEPETEETPTPEIDSETERRDSASVTPSASVTQPVTPSPTVTQPVTPSAPVTQPAAPTAPSASATQPVTPFPPVTQPAAPSAPVTQPAAPSASVTQPVTPSPTVTQPVTPSAPDSGATTESEQPPAVRGGQRIYLCLRGDGSASALLDALERHDIRAAVFCDETFLSEQGDLLRRMAATGVRIGLYVDSDSPASVLERLEARNEQLRRVTMEKTRLAYIDGAGQDVLRAAQEAGFVCLRPALDRTQFPLRTSRQAADLLDAVSQQPENVTVWLGGAANRSGLNAFINGALEIGDAFPAPDETALS